MYREIFDLLAQYGFKKSADLDKIFGLNSKDANKLHERLWELLFGLQYEGVPEDRETPAFRFVASRHLRGDTCPDCRVQKLEFLGRFAALYSDLVVVPLLLDRPSRSNSIKAAKSDLRDAIETLILLRPLIVTGIVRPAVMTTRNCCNFHADNLREFSELTHSFAEYLASEKFENFNMYYKPPIEPGGHCELQIEGPKKYIDHGAMFWRLANPPPWVAKSWRPGPDGRFKVPPHKLRATGLVQRIFDQIANDTTFHFAYGSTWKAKYLTDLPGEAELLRGLGDNGPSAQQNRATSLISAMTHALPFVGDLSIPEILKMRAEIFDSFEQYRWALTAIIRDHSSQRIGSRDAIDICAAELAPQIARLENKIAVERRGFRNRVFATSSVVGIVVTLGAFGLMQPAIGCGLLGGALTMLPGMFAESRSPIPEVATDDLYFLLRMKQARKRGGYVGYK